FENPASVAGLLQGLAEAGYVPSQSVMIEYRWTLNIGVLPRLVTLRDLDEAGVIVNRIAPEHLERHQGVEAGRADPGPDAAELADGEGLPAHAGSARYRIERK